MEETGQTSGLGLLGCRIAAGITTGPAPSLAVTSSSYIASTGTLAIFMAQPTDVVKARMQSAGKTALTVGILVSR